MVARFNDVRLPLKILESTSVPVFTTETLEALREVIIQEVGAISADMTRKVMDNFRERLWQCMDVATTVLQLQKKTLM